VTTATAAARARGLLPPLIAGVVLAGLWQAWVTLADVEKSLLPAPTQIFSAWREEYPVIRTAALATFGTALRGLLAGAVGGFATALVTMRFRTLARGITGLAVVAAATPIVVLAPIANIWFGLTEPLSKIVVVALVTFFPVYLNSLRGLDAATASDVELMRSYGASALTTLVRVRIPTSRPFAFTGLKLAASLAMITAIVSEYFGGSRRTLGVFISQQASLVRFDSAWAGIVAACVLSLVIYGAVLLAERLTQPGALARQQGRSHRLGYPQGESR
jgi:NitT/TauT family transport system permease protein